MGQWGTIFKICQKFTNLSVVKKVTQKCFHDNDRDSANSHIFLKNVKKLMI